MKKSLVILFAAVAFLASCQMSDITPGISKEYKVFTGTIVDDATRTGLVSDGNVWHVTWKLGDRIMINNEYEFTATVEDVTTTYFVQDTSSYRTNEPPVGPYTAVYPYQVFRGMPGVQNYVDGGPEFIPMAAQSETENLAFKNMVGILKLNVKTGDQGIVVRKIAITADQPMSGEYTIENDAAVVTGSAGVTINCGEGVAIGADPIPFYVTVPANTYTGMTIKVYTVDGKTASVKMKSGASFTVERSKLYEAEFPINGFTLPDNLGGVALLPSGPDFNTLIKQLAMDDPDANQATVDEFCVTRIVFNTRCLDTEGIEIQDLSSEKPIYLVYDKASGVVNINTPADVLKTPADASYMFATLGSLTHIDNLKCLNTEDAELMNHMFCYLGCSHRELQELDLSSFNTANATTMRSMFNGCRNITTLDLSTFDTSLVENMQFMFQYCVHLKSLDLKSFNTECVENMSYMFAYCYELESIDVSSFNTENCLSLAYMFGYCYKIPRLDLNSFNTENCENFQNFFRCCYELTDIQFDNFSFSNATEVRSFFNRCDALQKIDLSHIDGTNVTVSDKCGYFFYGAKNLREINVGDKFRFTCKPTYPFSEKKSAMVYRCGSEAGGITWYCDQDLCDYWASTGLRWLEHGYNSAGIDCTPIHSTFLHYKTGVELFPAEWPAD